MIPRKGKRWGIKYRFPLGRGYGIFNCIFLVLVLSLKTFELKLQSKWHNSGERGWRAADVVKSWTFLSCFVSWSSSVYFSDKQRKCYNCQTSTVPTNVVSIEAKNRQILCNCWQIMEIDAELVIVR